MLGIGKIEIEEATFCLGMDGHIVIRINATGDRYRVNHSMTDGWQVLKQEGREWGPPKRMSSEEFLAILPNGWSYESFIAAWAGYASGFEQGLATGKHEEQMRFKRWGC